MKLFANATWPMIYVYFVFRAAPSPSLTWGCLVCPTLPPSSTRHSLAFWRLARPRPKSCRQRMAAPRRPTSWQSRCRATTGSWTGLSGHSGCKSSRSSSSSQTQCCCDFPFCFGQTEWWQPYGSSANSYLRASDAVALPKLWFAQ